MCQVLKRQLWVIMHFPCICICTPKAHDSICAYLHRASVRASGWGKSVVPFCRPRLSRASVLNSGISWSMAATLGFALVQVNTQSPTTACGSQLIPQGLGCADIPPWGQQAVSLPVLPPWGKSLEVRCAVFQHAVGDIAGTKMGFIVTFFIKSINSPSNNLNAFSWPLLQVVPGERGKTNLVRIMPIVSGIYNGH